MNVYYIHSPLDQGLSHMVIKSTTGCSISSTVVDLPWSTVIHGDFPSRSIDKPPENIVNVSLLFHGGMKSSIRKWCRKSRKLNKIQVHGSIVIESSCDTQTSSSNRHQTNKREQRKICYQSEIEPNQISKCIYQMYGVIVREQKAAQN